MKIVQSKKLISFRVDSKLDREFRAYLIKQELQTGEKNTQQDFLEKLLKTKLEELKNG